MKSFPKEDRIVNWAEPVDSEGKKRTPTSGHCASCGDEGFLEVTFRTDQKWKAEPGEQTDLIGEIGPCPFCMEGHRREFPPETKEGHRRVGQWGPQGYWRGRDVPDELLRHPSQDEALPMGDQLVNARAMIARLQGHAMVKSIVEEKPLAERISDERWFAETFPETSGKPETKEEAAE